MLQVLVRIEPSGCPVTLLERFPDARVRVNDGSSVTVGARKLPATRASARAWSARAIAWRRSWLAASALAISRSSSGSAYSFHHCAGRVADGPLVGCVVASDLKPAGSG